MLQMYGHDRLQSPSCDLQLPFFQTCPFGAPVPAVLQAMVAASTTPLHYSCTQRMTLLTAWCA